MSAREAGSLRARNGAVADASVDVVRYGAGARLMRGGGVFATGLVLGVMTLPIPGLHLVMPWLLPLLTAGIGLYLWRVRLRVQRVEGRCPLCAGPVQAQGLGTVTPDESVWLRCGGCGAPLVLGVP